ncbi:MAG: type II toxin-antitoxin system prevent-host-death family antitoxin [Planctomycetes bacterium]|nr:type II toxin-antitoxin system prevent-host-death family antitoxin [Planctomycetota bacterium]
MIIAAYEFKAKCSSILERIHKTRETVTITKHGVPIVDVVPSARKRRRYPQDSLEASVRILGDIVSPALPPEAWEAERENANLGPRPGRSSSSGSKKALSRNR